MRFLDSKSLYCWDNCWDIVFNLANAFDSCKVGKGGIEARGPAGGVFEVEEDAPAAAAVGGVDVPRGFEAVDDDAPSGDPSEGPNKDPGERGGFNWSSGFSPVATPFKILI